MLNLQPVKVLRIANYFITQPVTRAYLFGSVVRDDFTETSDIDILVELDYSAPIGMAFYQMESDLENLTDRKVDLVSANGISKRILPFIDKEKVLIYER